MMEETRARMQRFLGLVGVTVPVLNAPMAGAAGPELCAAVCRAGGLGVLTGDELEPAELSHAIDAVRAVAGADARFAVNLRVPPTSAPDDAQKTLQQKMLAALEDVAIDVGAAMGELARLPAFDAQFEVVIAKRVPVISVTFGGLREVYDERVKEAGLLWMGTAATLKEAKVLRSAGADIIVVQGVEAGGPRLNFESTDDEAQVGLGVLAANAARATQLPVVASGGIGEPGQALAALEAGASAVMAGSAFLRTMESRASGALKEMLPLITDVSTRLTRCFNGRLTRVYPTDFVLALEESGLTFAPYPLQREVIRPILKAAESAGRGDMACLPAGQMAMLARAEPAAETVRRLASLLSKV